ncbi:MAG: hypothetical protein K2N63_16810 [Lachnospiraceae bacterium]|nr:hypothetical protein [Lachnospiraceae bacterium]
MQGKQGKMLGFLLVLAAVVLLAPFVRAQAAGKLSVVEIDYEAETLTVSSSSGDSYLYFSDSKMKNWECAYGTFSGTQYVLDISWVKKTKDYVLTLKGDKSDEVLSVTLPVQNKYLKVKYNCINESFEAEGNENRALYWRKADSTNWKLVDSTTVNEMRRLYAKGAALYLRTGQEKGSSTSFGARPSKEVKVSLSKQAAAPSLSMKTPGILTVNDKQEYQVEGADPKDWEKVEGKTLDLKKVATTAFTTYGSSARDTNVYVRVAATEKKLPSASAVITVRAQEAADEDIIPSFKNSNTLELKIEERKEDDTVTREKPSSKNPYEYTIVAADATLAEDAEWKTITSDTVLISKEKAPKGSTIYVRKAGRLESKLVYQPESMAWDYTVGEYPAESTVNPGDGPSVGVEQVDEVKVVDGKVSLIKMDGRKPAHLEFKITVTNFDTDVSKITCGGKNLEFTTTKTGTDVINVSITDTTAYEEAVKTRDTEQPVLITLKNGEVIKDKVTLTILRGASVKTEAAFKVTHRIAANQTDKYKFTVVPGLKIEMDTSDASQRQKTAISKITFQGDELVKGTMWSETVDSSGNYVVTIEESAFEAAFYKQDTKLETSYPIIIEMDNGQQVKSGVSVKLYEDAAVTSDQNIIAIYEGVGLDGLGGGSSEEDKVTPVIQVKLAFAKDGISVSKITWNGTVFKTAVLGGSKEITIPLSNQDLKELRLPDGVTSLTKPVVFELSNGSLVSTSFWLTLNK